MHLIKLSYLNQAFSSHRQSFDSRNEPDHGLNNTQKKIYLISEIDTFFTRNIRKTYQTIQFDYILITDMLICRENMKFMRNFAVEKNIFFEIFETFFTFKTDGKL